MPLLRRALGLAVVALVLGWPGSPAGAQDPPAPVAITSGSLDWGLRASFRTYVGNAGITLADGATRNADGTFRFPVQSGTFAAADNTTDVRLRGSVHFSAHDGALDLTVANPRIVLARGGSKLIADVTSKPLSGGAPAVYDDVELAELAIAGVTPTGSTTWSAIPAALTVAGAPAFAGFYAPGTELDPITLRYTGPGGKPDLTEEFTPPGTPRYSQVADGRDVYADAFYAADGLVHTAGLDGVTALTLTGVEQRGRAAWAGVTATAFDPETATVFAAGAAGTPIRTFRWNAQTSSYDAAEIAGSASFARTHLAYDTTRGKLYVVEGLASGQFTNTAAPVSPGATVIARDGAGWTVTAYPALATGGRAISGLAVSTQGRIAATQHATVTGTPSPATISASPAVQLTDTGSALTVTEIAGTVPPKPEGSFTFGYSSPTPGPGSNVTLLESAPLAGGAVNILDTTATGFTGTGRIPLGAPALDLAVDRVDGLIYAAVNTKKAVVIRDGAIAGTIDTPPTGATEFAPNALGAHGGTLFFNNNAAPVKLFAYKLSATSPTVISPPESATRTLLAGETSKSVAFSAGAIGDPAPTVQWQVRNSASAAWRDIAGATTTAIAQTITAADDGHQYRAVFENAGGRIATAPATLEVLAAPSALVQPADVAVIEGDDAVLKVGPAGNPYPAIQWQRRDDGFWVDVPDATGAFLTIEDTNVAMSGALFRARLTNSIGTTYSRPLELTVSDPPPDVVRVASGALDWGLKASFRSYIKGPIAHGAIAFSDGATENADGTFRFPLAGGELDRTRHEGEFRARGTVRFTGHDMGMGPLLDMTLTNPRVVIDGTTVTLFADVRSKSLNTGAMEEFPNVRFATLDGTVPLPDLSGPSATFGPFGAILTDSGAPAFAGFYAAGSVLDPVSIAVASWVAPGEDPPVEEPPVDTPDPEPTPTPTPTPVANVAPTPTPAPSAEPTRKPTLKRAAARQTIARAGLVSVATLRCGSATCTITRPRTVKLRIGGRSYTATVTGPTRLAAGKSGQVRVRLSRAALRALGRRTATAKIAVAITSGSDRVKQTITVRLKAR